MANQKLTVLRILKMAALILPVVLFLLFLPVNGSDDTRRIQDFYLEEPDSLDVVFLGSSDVYAGFSPVLAYEEFGFTSYSYVISGNYAGFLPYQMEDVLSRQSPKLFVIEITEAMNGKPEAYDHRLREYIAGVPSLSRKHTLVKDLGDPELSWSYYLPFSLYHGSADFQALWENAQRDLLVQRRGYSLLKGALTYCEGERQESSPPLINTTGDHETTELFDRSRENITNLLEFCQSKGYENVLFVTFPHQTGDEHAHYRHTQRNAAGELIRSYGYDYINFDCLLDDIGIRPRKDYIDDEHLNLYGQYKLTRYLGQILSEEYGIGEASLSSKSRSQWDTCVQYQHLYHKLFEDSIQPDNEGLWLKENAWLLTSLDQRR